MTREIKFRGRDKNTNEVKYLDLEKFFQTSLFVRKTIEQLIAVDRLGYEVYEGDTIRNESGWIKTASFEDYSAIKAGRAVLSY